MSIEILPTEILIQILDDASLEVGDLALISRVSRRWHSAVIPVLYKRFTFRYYYPLKEDDNKRLESFKKHGHHVRYLNLHIKQWIDESVATPPLDIARYLGILDYFSEVTFIEHYDIDVQGMSWLSFWKILNYLVSQKRKLISLTVRRNRHWSINPCSGEDLDAEMLLPTPRLPNLTYFNLRINSKRGGPDSPETFPYFLNNLVRSLGDSCRSVSNFQLYVKIFEADLEKLTPLLGLDVPLLPIDSLKELRYEILPEVISPPHLIDTKFEDIKILAVASYRVFGSSVNWIWENVPSAKYFDIKNVETLRITDTFTKDESDDFGAKLILMTKNLPKLKSLILENDERQFSISRKLDGTPIWEEVPFIF